MIPIREFNEGEYLTMITRNGLVKKTDIMEYATNRKGARIAIGLREDDELIDVMRTDGNAEIIIGTRNGMCIKFAQSDVRPMGRVAVGVRGMKLGAKDEVERVYFTRNGIEATIEYKEKTVIKNAQSCINTSFERGANVHNQPRTRGRKHKKEEPQLRELRVEALDWCG